MPTSLDMDDCADCAEARIGVKHTYDVQSERWRREECSIRLADSPFAKGGMRQCYKMSFGSGSAGVAKVFRRGMLPNHVEAKAYFDEAMTQTLADSYAMEFNNRKLVQNGQPVCLQFLPVGVMQIMGKKSMLCNVEPYLEGEYVKHNDNDGNVETQDEAPQAFSHYTWDLSNHQLVICDIQGVGGYLTDPQVHSEDGKSFGMGNLGMEGISKFLSTHQCNSLCRQLGLEQPVLNDGMWHAQLSEGNQEARGRKGVSITSGWSHYDCTMEAGLSRVASSSSSSVGTSRVASPLLKRGGSHSSNAHSLCTPPMSALPPLSREHSPLRVHSNRDLRARADSSPSSEPTSRTYGSPVTHKVTRSPESRRSLTEPAVSNRTRAPIAAVKAKVSKLFSLGKGMLSSPRNASPLRGNNLPRTDSSSSMSSTPMSPIGAVHRRQATAEERLEAARSPLLVALPACASKDILRRRVSGASSEAESPVSRDSVPRVLTEQSDEGKSAAEGAAAADPASIFTLGDSERAQTCLFNLCGGEGEGEGDGESRAPLFRSNLHGNAEDYESFLAKVAYKEEQTESMQVLKAWVGHGHKRELKGFSVVAGKLSSAFYQEDDAAEEDGRAAGVNASTLSISRAGSDNSVPEDGFLAMQAYRGRLGSTTSLSDASTLDRLASGGHDKTHEDATCGSQSPCPRGSKSPVRSPVQRKHISKKEKIAEMQSQLVLLKAQMHTQVSQLRQDGRSLSPLRMAVARIAQEQDPTSDAV